jgi:hypothetical protein
MTDPPNTLPKKRIPSSSQWNSNRVSQPNLTNQNMKTTLFHGIAVTAALALSASSITAANVVVNGDFSVDATLFSTFPGYSGGSNPAAIPSWTHIGAGSYGVNGVGISDPFGPADKSAATYYGFLQLSTSAMTQTVPLLANTTYDISFLAANRSNNASATGSVIIADNTTTYYDSGVTNWGNSAFQAVASQFSTGGSFDGAVVLTLSNDSPAGDNTVNYSNIVVDAVAVPEPSSTALLGLGGLALLLRRRR